MQDGPPDDKQTKDEFKLVARDEPAPAMIPKPPTTRPPSPVVYDPAIFEQILKNQTEELRLKGEEIKLRGSELGYQNEDLTRKYHYSLKAIEAQASDQKDQRQHIAKVTTLRYWFLFAGGLLIAAVIICAMLSGNKEFALEALKLLAAFGGGSGVGYGFGRRARGRQQPVEDPDEEPPESSRR